MLGYICALSCAFVWSVAVIIFKKAGDNINPVVLNLLKNVIGFSLLLPTVFIVEGTLALEIESRDFWILVLSGTLGIGLADTFFFKSLNQLGASLIAIVECLYAPFVILFSVLYLGEGLTTIRMIGGLLVISAILCVSIKKDKNSDRPKHFVSGVCYGAASMFFVAAGIVIVKPVFDRVGILWVTNIRMAAGALSSLLILLAFSKRREMLATLSKTKRWPLIIFGCVLGAYVSMILWVAGFKFIEASEAAILNQTATIFTVLLAAIFLHEKLTPQKILGTILAITGVIMITAT